MALINPGGGAIRTPEVYPYSPELRANALLRFIKCSLTGDVTILEPTNPVDGISVAMRLTSVGGDRNVSFDSSIVTSFAGNNFHGPVLIEAGTTLLIELAFDNDRGLWYVGNLLSQY